MKNLKRVMSLALVMIVMFSCVFNLTAIQAEGVNKTVTITIVDKYYDATVLAGDVLKPTPTDGNFTGIELKRKVEVNVGETVTLTPDYTTYKTALDGKCANNDYTWTSMAISGQYDLKMNDKGAYESVTFVANYDQTVTMNYRQAFVPVFVYTNFNANNELIDTYAYKGLALDAQEPSYPSKNFVRQHNAFSYDLGNAINFDNYEFTSYSVYSDGHFLLAEELPKYNIAFDGQTVTGVNEHAGDYVKSNGTDAIYVYIGFTYKQYSTTINYLNVDTNEPILENQILIGNAGSEYDYTSDINTEIQGYTFSSMSGDAVVGKLDENKVINVYFTADPEVPTEPIVPTEPTDPTPPVTPVLPTTPVVPQELTPVVPNVTPEITPDAVEEVTPEVTPAADVEEVETEETPKATLSGRSWALINLLCAGLTVLLGLFLLSSKRKKEEENEEEETEEEKRRGLFTRILSIVVAVASVIVFLLTEDMSLPMVMVDKWTIAMLAIALVQVAVFVIGRKWKNEENEEAVVNE